MTTHTAALPDDDQSPERHPVTTVTDASVQAQDSAMPNHRTDDRARGDTRPVRAQAPLGDHLLRIRRRVAEGVYDSPAMMAQVARLILDSGDLG